MKQINVFAFVISILLLLSACSSSDPNDPPDTQPLAAPEDLRARPGNTEVTLQWSDMGERETGFLIERRSDEGEFPLPEDSEYVAYKLTDLPSNTTRYTDGDVEAGITYTYRVRATREAETSDPSNEVTYTSRELERTEGQDSFSSVRSGGDNSSLVGVSDEFFANSLTNVGLSTSPESDFSLPEGLALFAPRITTSVPLSNIDLTANNDHAGSEIVVMPQEETDELSEENNTFALVRIETEMSPFEFVLPYDPAYPEFPVEISAEYLEYADKEHGLTDPVRIHVYPLYEKEEVEGLDIQVQKQKFGLFRLPEHTDYHAFFEEDCKTKNDFWSPSKISGEQELNGKTPLVLIHGWQTLGNIVYGLEIYQSGKIHTPQVCAWINFLDAYRTETGLHEQFELYTFSYDSDDRVEENAQKLADELESAFPDNPAVVVGHSMGGLVATTAKRTVDTEAIDFIVSLGTPYHGSILVSCARTRNDRCDHAQVNPELNDHVELSVTQKIGLANALGKNGSKDMAFERGLGEDPCGEFARSAAESDHFQVTCSALPVLDNPFLVDLNTYSPPSANDYFAFYGKLSPGEASGNELLDEINTTVNEVFGHNTDGVVSVGSATFGGTHSVPIDQVFEHTVFPNTHHNVLKGRNPEAARSFDDPLPKIINKLSELADDTPEHNECTESTDPDDFCVSGTIENWPGGEARIEAVEPYYNNDVLSDGDIASDGSFDLSLPTPPDSWLNEVANTETPENCTSDITWDPAHFWATETAFSAYVENGIARDVYRGSGTEEHWVQVVHLYVDREVEATGTQTCTQDDGATEILEADLSLSTGWNAVLFEYEESDGQHIDLSVTTGTIPDRVSWHVGESRVFSTSSNTDPQSHEKRARTFWGWNY